MKCKKFTYVSTLHGSVNCEELIQVDDGRVDFGPEGVYSLYNRVNNVGTWLDALEEDLTEYVPLDLKKLIVKAIFGKYIIVDETIQLITEIHVRKTPSVSEYDDIKEWVTGQLSDGWGESVEQKEVYVEDITVDTLEFDAYTCDFEQDTYKTEATYYIHPWASKDWCMERTDIEESEIDIPYQEPVVQRASCHHNAEVGTYTTKTMYRLADSDSAIRFIKESGACFSDELIRLIDEKGCLADPVQFYVIHFNEGIFSKFMPVLGVMNDNMARLFEIDAESGEIEMEDFKEDFHKEFYEDLMNR